MHFAAIGGEHARDDAQERGLARAVSSDHAERKPGIDRETHVGERFDHARRVRHAQLANEDILERRPFGDGWETKPLRESADFDGLRWNRAVPHTYSPKSSRYSSKKCSATANSANPKISGKSKASGRGHVPAYRML